MRTPLARLSLVLFLALPLAAGCPSCNPEVDDEEDGGGTSSGGSSGAIRPDASQPQDAAVPDAWAPPPPDASVLPDAARPDAWVPRPDAGRPDAAGPESRVLRFDGTSPLTVFYGTVTDLAFKVERPNTAAVSGAVVRFQTTGTGGTINVAQATTNTSGVATVRFSAGQVDGTITLVASTERAPDVTVVLQVRVNPVGGLALTLASSSGITITQAEALFWVGASPPTCATLATANPLPTATFNAEFQALPAQRTFADLVTGHKVTVVGRGSNPVTLVATACVEDITIAGGVNTPVTVTLAQRPTVFAGDYDVLMRIDMGNALPHPYDTTLDTVTAILADPVGYVVYQALRKIDEQTGTSFIWCDELLPSGCLNRYATYEEVTANANIFDTWRSLRETLIPVARQQVGAQTYDTVTMVGGDIKKVVSDFEVGTHYHLVTPAGLNPRHEITEQWNDLVFTWNYGCPAGDLGCARKPVVLDDVNLAPASTVYGAAIAHEPQAGGHSERYKVSPEFHSFQLNYGAIILIALNEVVFPNLPASVAGDSLGEVLANMVDCNAFGVAADGWVPDLFCDIPCTVNLCNVGLASAGVAIENQLLSLNVGGNPQLVGKEHEGVAGGGVFYLVDADHDLQTELVQELVMYVAWNDPENPTFTQDVTAPILGSGRMTATGCNVDANCPAGRVCDVIPHYLKVRLLEKDCRRPAGVAGGTTACTAHSDCQTNFCVDAVRTDAGVTPGSCYLSCNGPGTCTVPNTTCDTAGAAFDLDPTLQGLGDAVTATCLVP